MIETISGESRHRNGDDEEGRTTPLQSSTSSTQSHHPPGAGGGEESARLLHEMRRQLQEAAATAAAPYRSVTVSQRLAPYIPRLHYINGAGGTESRGDSAARSHVTEEEWRFTYPTELNTTRLSSIGREQWTDERAGRGTDSSQKRQSEETLQWMAQLRAAANQEDELEAKYETMGPSEEEALEITKKRTGVNQRRSRAAQLSHMDPSSVPSCLLLCPSTSGTDEQDAIDNEGRDDSDDTIVSSYAALHRLLYAPTPNLAHAVVEICLERLSIFNDKREGGGSACASHQLWSKAFFGKWLPTCFPSLEVLRLSAMHVTDQHLTSLLQSCYGPSHKATAAATHTAAGSFPVRLRAVPPATVTSSSSNSYATNVVTTAAAAIPVWICERQVLPRLRVLDLRHNELTSQVTGHLGRWLLHATGRAVMDSCGEDQQQRHSSSSFGLETLILMNNPSLCEGAGLVSLIGYLKQMAAMQGKRAFASKKTMASSGTGSSSGAWVHSVGIDADDREAAAAAAITTRGRGGGFELSFTLRHLDLSFCGAQVREATDLISAARGLPSLHHVDIAASRPAECMRYPSSRRVPLQQRPPEGELSSSSSTASLSVGLRGPWGSGWTLNQVREEMLELWEGTGDDASLLCSPITALDLTGAFRVEKVSNAALEALLCAGRQANALYQLETGRIHKPVLTPGNHFLWSRYAEEAGYQPMVLTDRTIRLEKGDEQQEYNAASHQSGAFTGGYVRIGDVCCESILHAAYCAVQAPTPVPLPPSFTTLQRLCLAGTGLSDIGVRALCLALTLPSSADHSDSTGLLLLQSLVELDLSGNLLSSVGCIRVLRTVCGGRGDDDDDDAVLFPRDSATVTTATTALRVLRLEEEEGVTDTSAVEALITTVSLYRRTISVTFSGSRHHQPPPPSIILPSSTGGRVLSQHHHPSSQAVAAAPLSSSPSSALREPSPTDRVLFITPSSASPSEGVTPRVTALPHEAAARRSSSSSSSPGNAPLPSSTTLNERRLQQSAMAEDDTLESETVRNEAAARERVEVHPERPHGEGAEATTATATAATHTEQISDGTSQPLDSDAFFSALSHTPAEAPPAATAVAVTDLPGQGQATPPPEAVSPNAKTPPSHAAATELANHEPSMRSFDLFFAHQCGDAVCQAWYLLHLAPQESHLATSTRLDGVSEFPPPSPLTDGTDGEERWRPSHLAHVARRCLETDLEKYLQEAVPEESPQKSSGPWAAGNGPMPQLSVRVLLPAEPPSSSPSPSKPSVRGAYQTTTPSSHLLKLHISTNLPRRTVRRRLRYLELSEEKQQPQQSETGGGALSSHTAHRFPCVQRLLHYFPEYNWFELWESLANGSADEGSEGTASSGKRQQQQQLKERAAKQYHPLPAALVHAYHGLEDTLLVTEVLQMKSVAAVKQEAQRRSSRKLTLPSAEQQQEILQMIGEGERVSVGPLSRPAPLSLYFKGIQAGFVQLLAQNQKGGDGGGSSGRNGGSNGLRGKRVMTGHWGPQRVCLRVVELPVLGKPLPFLALQLERKRLIRSSQLATVLLHPLCSMPMKQPQQQRTTSATATEQANPKARPGIAFRVGTMEEHSTARATTATGGGVHGKRRFACLSVTLDRHDGTPEHFGIPSLQLKQVLRQAAWTVMSSKTRKWKGGDDLDGSLRTLETMRSLEDDEGDSENDDVDRTTGSMSSSAFTTTETGSISFTEADCSYANEIAAVLVPGSDPSPSNGGTITLDIRVKQREEAENALQRLTAQLSEANQKWTHHTAAPAASTNAKKGSPASKKKKG